MIEENSVTWTTVKAWADKRIEQARDAMESKSCTDDDVKRYRGNIEELRALLRLPEQTIQQEPEEIED